jgi:hypothetical protein
LSSGNGRINSEKLLVGKYDTDEEFINAVIKVQQHREQDLTEAEAKTIKPWKLAQESDDILNK